MTGVQIIRLIILILLVLLAVAFFVIGVIIGRGNDTNASNKNFRTLTRMRVGCFIAMLILLLINLLI